jgi:hypothetical protein
MAAVGEPLTLACGKLVLAFYITSVSLLAGNGNIYIFLLF